MITLVLRRSGREPFAQADLLVVDAGWRATMPVEIVLRIDAGKGTLAT